MLIRRCSPFFYPFEIGAVKNPFGIIFPILLHVRAQNHVVSHKKTTRTEEEDEKRANVHVSIVCVEWRETSNQGPSPLGGGGGTALLFPPSSSIDFLPLLKHGVFLFLLFFRARDCTCSVWLLLPAERRQHIALLSSSLHLHMQHVYKIAGEGKGMVGRGAEGFNKGIVDHPSFALNSAFSNQVYVLLLEKLVKSSPGKVAISPSFSPPPTL